MSNRRKRSNANHLPGEDPRMGAAAALLRRMGAAQFELRFSEPDRSVSPTDHSSPIVWIAIAYFAGARPQVAAALVPYRALYRLLEQLVDGGHCTHCHRLTGISDDLEPMPLDKLICWYVYDPELDTFRRGCEGS